MAITDKKKLKALSITDLHTIEEMASKAYKKEDTPPARKEELKQMITECRVEILVRLDEIWKS